MYELRNLKEERLFLPIVMIDFQGLEYWNSLNCIKNVELEWEEQLIKKVWGLDGWYNRYIKKRRKKKLERDEKYKKYDRAIGLCRGNCGLG